jgi:hypothetical protein
MPPLPPFRTRTPRPQVAKVEALPRRTLLAAGTAAIALGLAVLTVDD